MITGELSPTEGTISKHSALKLAKYSQHSADQLPYNKSPLEHFESLFHAKFPDKDLQFWRSQLGRFGLSGTHQTSPISQLSDGLRNRVVFSQLAMEYPSVILLDEPTNHLDMESIDALASAIKTFSGGVVIVSHDFRLISQVAEEIWEVKGKKIINLSKEGMTIVDYKVSHLSHDTLTFRLSLTLASPPPLLPTRTCSPSDRRSRSPRPSFPARRTRLLSPSRFLVSHLAVFLRGSVVSFVALVPHIFSFLFTLSDPLRLLHTHRFLTQTDTLSRYDDLCSQHDHLSRRDLA